MVYTVRHSHGCVMDKVSLKEVNTFDEMMKMDGWIMTEIQFYSISPSVLVFPFSFENGSTLVATIATSSKREKTRFKPKCGFHVF